MSVSATTDRLQSELERQYCMLTSSGSAALIAALRSVGLPAGSDVLMPAICCPAVLFAIQLAGYGCVLADVDVETLNSGVEEFDRVLTPKTAAIVAVHGFGRYCEIEEIAAYAKRKRLFLVEDACLALGGSFHGRPLGSFGDVSILSFGYDKPVACDYGGALLANDADISESAQEFFAKNTFFAYRPDGTREHELLKALGQLGGNVRHRRANTRLIEEELKSEFVTMPAKADDIVYWRYPILVKSNRDGFIKRAGEAGLLFTTHYKNLAELMTGVSRPTAEHVSKHIINMFVRPGTPDHQIRDQVAFLNRCHHDR